MQSNERLYRILATRRLGGEAPAISYSSAEPTSTLVNDLRLFALTFAAGFLFTTIFIA